MAEFVPVTEVTEDEKFTPVAEVDDTPFTPVEEVTEEPQQTVSAKPIIRAPGELADRLAAEPSAVPQMLPSQAERIQASAATPEEQATTAKLQKPLMNLPLEAYAAPVTTFLSPESGKAFAGMAKSLIESQTSPEGLSQLPYLALGGAEAKALQGAGQVGKLLGRTFALQGAAAMPEAVKEYYEAVKAGDKERAAKAWGGLAMNSLMAVGGLEAVKGKGKPPVIEPEAPPPGVVAEPSTLAKPVLLKESEAELNKLPGGSDALQIGKPTPVPVEVPPVTSAEVGARIPQPETPAVPQGQREPQPQPAAQESGAVRDVGLAQRLVEAITNDISAAEKEKGSPLTEEEGQRVIQNVTGFFVKGNEEVTAAVKKDGWASLEPSDLQFLSDNQRAVYDKWVEAGKPEGAGKETSPPTPAAEGGAEVAATTTPAPSAPVEAGGATPEIIGMGGARPEEFPADPGNPDIYGVAERVRSERAKAGQVGEVPPGEGISPADSVEHGREMLASGSDPEAALKAFEQTGRLSSDDMAVTRAHGEQLAFKARRIEEQFGTESPEYQAAKQALTDWDTRTKAMQTEWHKTGQAQQGETDIDTGSFTGLERAYRQDTGKDFNEKQTKTAKKKAKAVKDATDQETAAKDKLFKHIKEQATKTDAEKAALQAAHDAVVRGAKKLADLETAKRVADQERQAAIAKIEAEREAKIKAAATKLEKQNALKAAKKAITEADAAAKRKKAIAAEQAKAEQKTIDAANKLLRERAVKAARESAKEREARADVPTYAWNKVREYIDQGMDNFDDIRNKVATDMGLPVEKVTAALARDKTAKYLADDAWRKQQVARQVRQQAKQWLHDTTIPGYQRALLNVPRLLFSAKVGFHGTVALGTHAPMVAFQPRFWATYVRDFGKMYKMVGTLTRGGQNRARAYYEMQAQDLMRRPNYMTARRAGLVNDPFQYEDYNSPDTTKYFGKLTTMGNRGYTVLKILRQDMFDQMWNQLPRTAQIPEMAAALADGINHSTGVVQGRAPRGTNVALFAPRLEASRVMWLVGDPIRAANTFLQWNKATPAEKMFAINQIKEKAWVAGTMMSALALNQGFLNATDSKQKINGIPEALGGKGFDPFRSDFMKFKAAGMDFSYGNAMISMARLPVRLYKIRTSDGGKLKNLVYPDEDTYSVLGQYARSQASPFASLATTLWLKADFQNRPLPNSTRPMPKRLDAQGVKPYTWPEFWAEQVLPIPAEEAVREVWKEGLGMSEKQIQQGLKALATISVMAATGARLTDDVPGKPPVGTLYP